MRAAIPSWLPWILVALAMGVFLLVPDASGPALVLIWGSIVLAARFIVSLLPDRAARLSVDAFAVLGCFLAAFEGGWYLLPAAIAFMVRDWRAGPAVRPLRGSGPARRESLLGIAAAAVGLAGLAVALFGPFYASQQATLASGDVVDSPPTTSSLISIGLTPRAAAVLVLATALLGVVAAASVTHERTGRRWARTVLGAAVLGLAAIALAGALTIGALLLPAVVCGLAAWALGGRRTPSES